jgi:hypothetical protein
MSATLTMDQETTATTPAAEQRPLALEVRDPLAQVGLATMEWVRRQTGRDAETITTWVDSGRLLWVFDVAAVVGSAAGARTGNREVRELRFWPAEVGALRDGKALKRVQGLAVAEALAQIVGTQKERLRSAEVSQLLLVSYPQVWRLSRSGELLGAISGHTRWIWRASLIAFLQKRWVGAGARTEAREGRKV